MEIFYGLTENDIKDKKVNYMENSKYKYKGINLTLEGLKRFIHDNNIEEIIKYYTILDSSVFELVSEIDEDAHYSMIAIKIPFSFEINSYYKL